MPDPFDSTRNPATPTVDLPLPQTTDATRTAPNGSTPVPGAGGLPDLPGYDVIGELGRGGMGVVYRAHDRKLNRSVAIKMILGGHVAGPSALVRFLAEAEALAALDHPHVVHVFDRGEYQGLPYYVMEFCPGGSLGARVREHPLPARDAAVLVERLARGVAAAHARNILHRDLKPENVLFAADGTPKLTDFGLAKRLDESGEAATGLTVTGAVMGTPSYMAPEQARGDIRRIGPAADVYSLGAVLYRTITGRPPFLGANSADTARQVIDDEPVSPTQLVPGLPRDLSIISLKCLHKDPARRYASATELATDLARFLDGRPIQARPVGPGERAAKWVRRNPAVAASGLAVAAALVAGTVVSYAKYREAKAQEGVAADKAAEADRKAAEAAAALRLADDRADELKYQLGISDMVLAQVAHDQRDVIRAGERLAAVPAGQRGWEWHFLRRQVRGGIFTLYGHAGPVTGVAFRPDGRQVATAGRDGVRLWDARTGAGLGVLTGHAGGVSAVAFDPDRDRIATAGEDGTVRLWDTRTGDAIRTIRAHVGRASAVAFVPDGVRLATAGQDARVRIWDSRTGEAVVELRGSGSALAGLAVSPDGARVAAAGEDGTARVWDVRTRAVVAESEALPAGVTAVAFSPDGFRLAIAGDDGTTRVWDTRTRAAVVELAGHQGGVTSVAFSPDGARVATAGADRAVRLWDARSGAALGDLVGHTAAVLGAAFSPDGARVATASADGTAKVWEARPGAPHVEFRGHTDKVSGVAVSPDGARVVASGWDGTARVWDARSGAAVLLLRGTGVPEIAVAFSPDGARLATAGLDNRARVWDARSGGVVVELEDAHADGVWAVAFGADSGQLVTGGGDGMARVWDLHTRAALVTLTGHAGAVLGVAVRPDGSRVATAGADGTARVWDTQTGATVARLVGHQGEVRAVAFSPDGARVATAGRDGTVRVWDAATGDPLLVLKGHTDPVFGVAFSPDGARLASAGWDGRARVWDARTGTPLGEVRGHAGAVTAVAFSADGARLVTASYDGTARLWDARPAPSADGPPPIGVRPGQVTPDGRFFAHPSGERVELVAIGWDADEVEDRLIHTRPNARRYRDGLVAADRADDPLASRFYLDRLMSVPGERTANHFRAREVIAADPRLTARAAFHHPELAGTPYDRPIVEALAAAGDRLAGRLIAQERLRQGQPQLAVPLLVHSLLNRPANAPPVEELLLARAYLDLKQSDEARRYYLAAVTWLDRPRDPMRAANAITHAINPINAVGEVFKPIDDPRHNPFDWESWHECDVFRADVERRLAAGR